MGDQQNQDDKTVYDMSEVFCKYCGDTIPNPSKRIEFCRNGNKCKDAFHKEDRLNGAKKRKSKGMHFARIDTSKRPLKEILACLSDGKKKTTLDIDRYLRFRSRVCLHVSQAINEIRQNGYNISPAKYLYSTDGGSKVYEYQLL